MQLKKIKLSGFKSFVDPTNVLLPSNLVAVVGPNGCGKSNIIDAVCWVMGESSAKYLRGESLTDVIFNGSSARKPVGQASVELVFDNQDGTLGGEYASYAEISIRRQISRESESAYFLNGVRCRRRDIIDIFLGTGLGPRSYSIIGQNMISRIIEAKPDDMRVYLEEAAGVSRYKERRRETENRIQHTKDNLARLNDVRLELDKQLNTLKRQANAAEKFQVLKQEERIVRAQWLTIQWRDKDAELVNETLQIQQQSTGLEARQAELGELNLQLEYEREKERAAQETLQEVQRRYYAIGSDITRLEQDIHHYEERQKQWQQDLQQTDRDLVEIQEALFEAEEEQETLTEEAEGLLPLYQSTSEEVSLAAAALNESEEAMQNWQTEWDEFNQQSANNTQIAQVEQTRIQHLEQKITSLDQRQARIDQEKSHIDFSKLEEEIAVISEAAALAIDKKEESANQLAEVNDQMAALRTEQQKTTEELHQVRNELQILSGRKASLEALQETALGRRNQNLTEWLFKHKLDKKPRLAERVEVESGWEYAVEKVLGAYLQAVCVENLSDVAGLVGQFKEGSLCIVAQNPLATGIKTIENTLFSKIKSSWPLASLFSGIHIADTEEEAFAKAATLSANESIITRDGVWLGATWLRLSGNDNPEAGIFQRDQELKQITKQIAMLTEQQDSLEEAVVSQREQLKELETTRELLQKATNQYHAEAAEISAKYKMSEERLTELKKRIEQFNKEQAECKAQFLQAEADLKTSRAKWQEAMTELESQTEKRDKLIQSRDQLRDQLQKARNQLNQVKDESHQLEIRLQTTKSQQTSLQQSIVRLKGQLSALTGRKAVLENDSSALFSPEALQKELSAALSSRLTIESDLNNTRQTMESVTQALQAFEGRRQELDREIAGYRDMLETLRVESQGMRVKAEMLIEQIRETGFRIEDVLQELPEVTDANEWHARLDQITSRISRLGAINLVAIEEYATCSERKSYLDKQNEDLQEGLATLESAIAKIDKETRARFKETFDKVNNRFQELFPTVFGGGHACLELTGENLLDAGITVMACPPGKRNSTIHLLSGGEKALTAIALVFSIFHLNPAPFCLLDEVDAPLDDANIGRFCRLVKAMSEKTQFIFISHNKLAIEMGENLIGVTMHEPGVSRLVSVDIEEAMSLAGA